MRMIKELADAMKIHIKKVRMHEEPVHSSSKTCSTMSLKYNSFNSLVI